MKITTIVKNLTFRVSILGIMAGVSVTILQEKSYAANFAGLKSQICNGLPGGSFCVDEVIGISKNWFYDDPKLNPLKYDGSWKSDPIGSDASGRRFREITDQSYQIDFKGNFEEVIAIGWDGNLLKQNDAYSEDLR